MNHPERARDVLPVLAALYALVMVSNIHAAPFPVAPTLEASRVVSGLKWHMLEIARAEQNEAVFFPGN
ncbi:hypothetical protein FV223_03385 [Methylobacterium sp. WL116]|nr:hypothetical protein FV223_03385 [Methylobacterium sp. WL116]